MWGKYALQKVEEVVTATQRWAQIRKVEGLKSWEIWFACQLIRSPYQRHALTWNKWHALTGNCELHATTRWNHLGLGMHQLEKFPRHGWFLYTRSHIFEFPRNTYPDLDSLRRQHDVTLGLQLQMNRPVVVSCVRIVSQGGNALILRWASWLHSVSSEDT